MPYRRKLNVSVTRKVNLKMNDILNPLNHRGENYAEMSVEEMRQRLRQWADRNPGSGYYAPVTHAQAVQDWQHRQETKQLELFPPTLP